MPLKVKKKQSNFKEKVVTMAVDGHKSSQRIAALQVSGPLGVQDMG